MGNPVIVSFFTVKLFLQGSMGGEACLWSVVAIGHNHKNAQESDSLSSSTGELCITFQDFLQHKAWARIQMYQFIMDLTVSVHMFRMTVCILLF